MKWWLGILCGLVLVTGCARRENVVVVVIDTLRPDRLGCYGHERGTSPFIDSLAAQGVVFEQAYSTSSWTVPSVASLMTGLPPRGHGCRHGIIHKGSRGLADQEVLAEEIETLAERMRSLGYRTYGVSANPHISREMGFAQGFDQFETLWLADAAAINGVVEMWQAELTKRRRRPFFLYVHYLDPHAPYHARAPWIEEFAAGSTNHVPFDSVTPEVRDALLVSGWRAAAGDSAAQAAFTAAARQGLLDLYDSEIGYVDKHLRQLLQRLGVEPGRDTVVVTADHGEEFLEHRGGTGHGKTLYETVVRIPLIWCGPQVKAAGRRVATAVSLVDIFPTLAALNKSPLPADTAGISLAGALQEGREPQERSLVMETERFAAHVWLGMRDEGWKYMLRAAAGGAERELYHLQRDPGERENLAAGNETMTAAFDASLNAWLKERPERRAQRASVWLDSKREQELRSLGYLK